MQLSKLRSLMMLLLTLTASSLSSQEVDLANDIFGNEWVHFDKSYIKIEVAHDDIYKVTWKQLVAAGFDSTATAFGGLMIQHLGKEVHWYLNKIDDNYRNEDNYIVFYGKQNRSELDKYLYSDISQEALNDNYSVVSDTAAYFLSWGHATAAQQMPKTNIDYTLPLSETRVYLHIEDNNYTTWHYKPVANSQNVRYSSFQKVEGYSSNITPSFTENFDIVDRVNVGIPPVLKYRYGTNRNGHVVRVTVNGTELKTYNDPAIRNHMGILDTVLDYGSLTDKLTLTFAATAPTALLPSQTYFSYTRNIDAAKYLPQDIVIPARNADRYFKIKNYTGPALDVYNHRTHQVYNTVVENGNLVIFVPASTIDTKISLMDAPANQVQLSTPSFIDFSAMDYEYIILTSRILNNDQGGSNPIADYVDYRSSADGGGFKTGAIDVEDLYDQFAYGINRHFLAIRHFAHYAHHHWTDTKFFFIIGKGREYGNHRRDFQITNPQEPRMLVPTYGMPGSDNLLLSKPTEATLLMPLGRLAANNKQEVTDYLRKIQEHDANINNPATIDDRLWMKHILHLSGGDTKIQESIRLQLDDMAAKIEDSKMGAMVTTFLKYSTTPIEVAYSQGLLKLVNDGLAMVTFFGHSSGGNLDFDMGDIRNFSNRGKYPLMIALGCNAGNIHSNTTLGVSERYVNVANKGMLGFLASTGTAYQYQQYEYGADLYETLGNEHYGEPIGQAINAVIELYKDQTDLGTETFLQQVTLHGDPAMSFLSGEAPDFIPDGSTAKTFPAVVNSYEETFDFCVDIVNTGQHVLDSIDVQISHIGGSNAIITDTIVRWLSPANRETYCITLPTGNEGNVGQQRIFVKVDAPDAIAEYPAPDAELNNELLINGDKGYPFIILNTTAKPIYPQEFGITNKVRPTLLASTYNPLQDPQDFIIQLDTSGFFDSPALISQRLDQVRGLIEWTVPYDLSHERVYYWRVAPDTVGTGRDYVWCESSFMYHREVEGGWNQSHYYQFLKDTLVNLRLQKNDKLAFALNFQDLQIVNRDYRNGSERPHFYVRGNSFSEAMDNRLEKMIAVAIIDSTGQYIKNPKPGIYGTPNLWTVPITTYFFKTTTQDDRSLLYQFFDEFVGDDTKVPLKSTVIIYSHDVFNKGDFGFEDWDSDTLTLGTSIFRLLKERGAAQVDLMRSYGDVLPYVMAYTKGENNETSLLVESISDSPTNPITVNISVPGYWFEGKVISTKIGPAKSWKSFIWEEEKSARPENDTTSVSIYGYDNQGEKVLLIDKSMEYQLDLSTINSNDYPYLHAEFNTKDRRNFTSSHLVKWNTLYEPTSDVAFDFDGQAYVHKDTIQEGDAFRLDLPVVNYMNDVFGATSANITITNQNNETQTFTAPLESIAAKSTKRLTYAWNTEGQQGDYQVQVTINPDNDPMEIHRFNNVANYRFHIFREYINPVLDVTFDGVHILDEDIVSARPIIAIAVQDENPFLLLNDTSAYDISITDALGQVTYLSMDDPSLTFKPATSGSDNQAIIEYRPEFATEGTYTLAVRSRDRTGNTTGAVAYEVRFRVILEEAISEVYNYPNPFSTSTEFVFTLTGTTLPDDYAIQIMTITGKVVKVIERDELGPLHIGVNRTSYKWDGRDDLGQKLANGVYLYKFMVKRADGQRYKNFEIEGTSQHFKKGWGKMVILR